MAVFLYVARNREGKNIKGQIEAETKDKAIEYLQNEGAIILSIREGSAKKAQAVKKGRVRVDELVIFSRQLTTLIESGIPVVGSLDILYQQTQNLYFKRIVGLVTKDLKEGSSFAAAIAKYSNVFSELYISMVEAAEVSGNLPRILDRLSVYLERANALRKKVISSLTYPMVVITVAILITAFLMLKVVPTFKAIFSTLGGALPLPTKILIFVADTLQQWILVILIAFVIVIVALARYISTPKGKRRYHRLLVNLPIIGDLVIKLSIAKFARTFSTLTKSGVPIMNSLEIVGKTSGNKIIEDAVMSAKKSIQEGIPLSVPLEASRIFPPMVIRMISVGEQTGKLEEMLSKIAEFYEEQTEAIMSGLTSIIEPLVIAFLGIVVGSIVVALFLPIIKITEIIGR